jgi:hypothetical protein
MPISNPIPERLARAVNVKVPALQELGRPDAEMVFLTAAADVEGLSATQLAFRLGVEPASSFYPIEFPTTSLKGPLLSPIRERAQCFVGGGRTRGGAREFRAFNQTIPIDAEITIVS